MIKARGNIENLEIRVTEKLNQRQQEEVGELQKLAFTEVEDLEAEEDFYHPKSAQVLAYIDDKLVGWAGIHESQQTFKEKRVRLGGYGICTHPEHAGKGIATQVSRCAMQYLKDKGVEVGFLSVDPNNEVSIRLHKKNGFVMLTRNFSWTNSKGEIKQSSGGMITPINSQELFEYVLNDKDVLYIGNGYW